MTKPSNLISLLLDGPFTLRQRPEPLPGDLRLSWGIALVILILGKSRGKRASLQKLHFLGHAARTQEGRREIQQVFSHELRPSEIVVRVEPWLNRALAFARGSGLIEIVGGKSVKLIEPGILLLDTISKDESTFREEKDFLDSIATQATEGTITRILKMEHLL